jgi:hypothetical protein
MHRVFKIKSRIEPEDDNRPQKMELYDFEAPKGPGNQSHLKKNKK